MTWDHGDEILWCYRREAVPARVVSDDDSGLVVWIEAGTPLLRPVNVDGRGVRDRPIEERFRAPTEFAVVPWHGAGVLRIAPRNAAHSLWLFRRPDGSGEFWGWYGNLERPHVRSEHGVHSHDHTLDLWLDADGWIIWKDEDELAAAVEQGHLSIDDAAEIRAEGERVHAAMTRRDAPFDGSWLDWRPEPAWTTPALPEFLVRMAGEPGAAIFPELVGDAPGR